jgi:Pyruvate/2-oxoacid:ferredoxin oxidoreductase gamma subunit
MEDKNVFNLIVSGVGGQGVFSLTKVLWNICNKSGIKCQGSVFKGGAQRMGTIYSCLRIFNSGIEDYSSYSVQVFKGELDLIIGLEPWETLRYQEYFNKNTRIIMNESIYPLFMDRYKEFSVKDPVKSIHDMGLFTISRNYTGEAIAKFKSKKMTNFLIGQECIDQGFLPFNTQIYLEAFSEVLRLPKELLTI